MTYELSRYSHLWSDLWEPLTPIEGRMLDQILVGKSIMGCEPDRTYAEACADLVAERIDADEFAARLGLEPEPRAVRVSKWWQTGVDDEL